jgi:hypothetical protein
MTCIFINYGVGVKGYKLWDFVAGNVLYRNNVIFRKVKSSSTVVQPKEDGKKFMVQIPPKTKKFEPKNEQ